MEDKTCTKCGESKHLTQFNRQKTESGTITLHSHCKECRAIYFKQLQENKLKLKQNEINIENCEDSSACIIPGYPNYSITQEGVIKNLKFGRILNGNMMSGCKWVTLRNKGKGSRFQVHRLLAIAFKPPKDLKEIETSTVIFKDGNPNNYALENLEWITKSENRRRSRMKNRKFLTSRFIGVYEKQYSTNNKWEAREEKKKELRLEKDLFVHIDIANPKKRKNPFGKQQGIFFNKKKEKWIVKITQNGEEIKLGEFDNSEDAARVYSKKAKIYFVKFNEV